MHTSTLLATAASVALAAASPIVSNQSITIKEIEYFCSSGGCLWFFNATAPEQGPGCPALPSTWCFGTDYNRDYRACEAITPLADGVVAQNLSAWLERPDTDDIYDKLFHLKCEVTTNEGASYTWFAEKIVTTLRQPDILHDSIPLPVVSATANL